MIAYVLLTCSTCLSAFALAKDWKNHDHAWRRGGVTVLIALIYVIGIWNLHKSDLQHQEERLRLEASNRELNENLLALQHQQRQASIDLERSGSDLKQSQNEIRKLTRTVVSQNDMLSTDIMGGGTVWIEPGPTPPGSFSGQDTTLIANSLSRSHIYDLSLRVYQLPTNGDGTVDILIKLKQRTQPVHCSISDLPPLARVDTGCDITQLLVGSPVVIEVTDKRGPMLVEVCTYTGSPKPHMLQYDTSKFLDLGASLADPKLEHEQSPPPPSLICKLH